jgi:hypothetical protein
MQEKAALVTGKMSCALFSRADKIPRIKLKYQVRFRSGAAERPDRMASFNAEFDDVGRTRTYDKSGVIVVVN